MEVAAVIGIAIALVALIAITKSNRRNRVTSKATARRRIESETSDRPTNQPLPTRQKTSQRISERKIQTQSKDNTNTSSLPKGKYLAWSKSVQNPVKSGFLKKEEWEEFQKHYDPKLLNADTAQRVKDWHAAKKKAYDYNDARYKDLGRVRTYIKSCINFRDKECVKPKYKSEMAISKYTNGTLCWYDKKSFWGAQCLALTKIKWIDKNFSCFHAKKNPQKLLGANLDELYPLISNEDELHFFYSLIYDFGYGPNMFPWHESRVDEETLANKKTKLYLVAIDIGRMTQEDTYIVHKVGITTKDKVIGGGSTSRFSGKFQEYIKEIRCIEYDDGRIAYMKEQTILSLAAQGKTINGNGSKWHADRLSDTDIRTLGMSEWILEGKPKKAQKLFDEITGFDP